MQMQNVSAVEQPSHGVTRFNAHDPLNQIAFASEQQLKVAKVGKPAVSFLDVLPYARRFTADHANPVSQSHLRGGHADGRRGRTPLGWIQRWDDMHNVHESPRLVRVDMKPQVYASARRLRFAAGKKEN